MSEQAALPVSGPAPVGASEQQQQPAVIPTTDTPEGAQPEGQAQGEGAEGQEETKAKPEKTPEQRELDRARRKIDRLVRQREELRAQVGQRLPNGGEVSDNQATEGDSERLTLSRAELQSMVRAEAEKLAPAIKEQQAGIEQRAKIVEGLAKEWGKDKFDALASDLNEAFDGLTDRSGRPKPATDAIFESDDPKALIEYLADPENADEAESLSRMTDRQLGRAMARLEDKVQALKKSDKPQPSRLPPPIENGRGAGSSQSSMPDPSNVKAYVKWANEQERKRA